MTVLALLIGVSLALGILAWLFFVWTVKSGQYEDPEGAKDRMLEDDEPAQRPPSDATTRATASASRPEGSRDGS